MVPLNSQNLEGRGGSVNWKMAIGPIGTPYIRGGLCRQFLATLPWPVTKIWSESVSFSYLVYMAIYGPYMAIYGHISPIYGHI